MAAKARDTQRNRATGQYTDTRLEKPCACGHQLGQHTAERVGNQQECLADGCVCESFSKVKGA